MGEPMSDRDVDAQFADIVAHWDDVAALPDHEVDRQGTTDPEPTTDQATSLPGAVNPSPLRDDLPPAGLPTADLPADDAAAGRGDQPGEVLGSIPVWRGATTPPQDPATAARADADDEEDADDHFVPGPTAPLPPQEDLHFWGTVVGLVAGPLLLLWLVIFRPGVSGWWTLGALGLTVGGFVLLVLRQPSSRDEDDPDNGARV
jgi:hypothetical protein